MKEFTNNNNTLVFYKKEGDEKYSFYIKDNSELTELLLSNVSTKRIRENKIKYAVKGIFEKINNELLVKLNTIENPIVELAEKAQKMYGSNIEAKIVGKCGDNCCPIIEVEIELPNGNTYRAKGTNQKIAKRNAAEKALLDL